MGVWGKLFGGVAGFAVGGPAGAMMGAVLGHAFDQGAPILGSTLGNASFSPVRLAALLGRRDQVFAIGVVVLAAKLAKCDGPVVRAEIDAFKRQFRVPAENAREVGRLFDQARDSAEGVDSYASQLGESFSDNLGLLEDVLAALFTIARADKPLTRGEDAMLRRVHTLFGLDAAAWARASGQAAPRAAVGPEDAYAVLGVARNASDEEVRATWKRLMRENHPDSLASRGVPPEFIASAGEKVARINAAWDRIKRDRGL